MDQEQEHRLQTALATVRVKTDRLSPKAQCFFWRSLAERWENWHRWRTTARERDEWMERLWRRAEEIDRAV